VQWGPYHVTRTLDCTAGGNGNQKNRTETRVFLDAEGRDSCGSSDLDRSLLDGMKRRAGTHDYGAGAKALVRAAHCGL
jgi:hypothetical protein